MTISVMFPGSEINFFMQAPTGDWNYFFSRQMEKCGRQNFPLQRNTNNWKILLANFSFRNQSEENGSGVAMAIFPITNKISTEISRQTNHADHISSFVQLKNVSSQLYTFSCAQLKNCCLVLCYVQSDLSFCVLSRRSTDRHVAPCCSHQATTVQHFSSQSPESSAKRTLWETAKNNTTEKVRTRAVSISRVAFFRPASHCSQLYEKLW